MPTPTKAYDSLILDTNCIIFYCFNFVHRYKKLKSREISISDKVGTAAMHALVPAERVKGKIFLTLKCGLAEIEKKTAAVIVDSYIRQHPAEFNSFSAGELAQLAYELTEKLIGKIKNFTEHSWVKIDQTYAAKPPHPKNVVDLYRRLDAAADPRMAHMVTKKKKHTPSFVDIELICFSRDISQPLVSRDRDITDFKPELEAEALAYEICPLV